MQLPICASSQKQALVVAEDSIQRAARLARQMPGYRWVRRRAVPRIRRSAAARALAHRMFPTESPRGPGPPADVAAGELLAGLGVEQLPVVLLSLVGLTDGTADNAAVSKVVDAVIDEVAETQLLGAGFRPVFLLDTPAFGRVRGYRYVAELVPPRAAWAGDPVDWSAYVAARVASIRTTYGVSAMITVGADGLDEVSRGVLRSFG
jgi:hypothetical protein